MAAKVRNTWMTNAFLFLQFAIRDLQVYNSQNEVPRDGGDHVTRVHTRKDTVVFLQRHCGLQ
jgi:hypothetical protein